ncbi:PQQ-dependent sugar dehydrogenase [Paraconexibacter antarcticus]|uniref:PQQ-dependent sugar dehydrogenase n=1 Tax=Paraconexibacter antarcticus TaxID=2949664 RepID=A0ABY5DVI0_9ACTN|nr:PQQ-dependent sugar dehydrogenase [Paraconexibacter antarcticus]UTI65651.1 PQQ-dependent sugar dehydrogenase [Paraconexibacter antarcticus]
MRGRAGRSVAALGAAVVAIGILACGSGVPADGYPAAGGATGAKHLALLGIGTFDSPLYVTAGPGDDRRLFVVEQPGRIRIIRGGRTLARPFLDITRRVTSGGEQGLLSVAFAPDYARSGRFYVYYTDKEQQQRVVEYRRATADRAAAGSARLVLKMADRESNHNGGLLTFGPDGLLYIGTGDGGGADDQHGSRGNAQDLTSPLGKLLRIDPRAAGGRPYSIPASNPFAGRGGGVRGEIYSYGLRNPWRYAFDRATGELVIGDVGQNTIEEVDVVAKGKGRGANFGWRPFEGTDVHSPGEAAPGAIAPVIQLRHSDGYCSITGGYVVRDPSLPASLRGRYLYSDFCKGDIRAAKVSPSGASGDRGLPLKTVQSLSSFGQDNRGRIYVVSLSGAVYRLVAR